MARRFLVVDLPFVPDVDALIDGTGATARLVMPEPAAE